MKTNCYTFSVALALVLGVLSTQSLTAGGDPTLADITKSLSNAKVLELPAVAAGIVSGAKNQSSVANLVLQAIASLRPATMVPVVGAIVRTTPTLMDGVVATAGKLEPSEKSAIAEAADFAFQSVSDGHGNGNDIDHPTHPTHPTHPIHPPHPPHPPTHYESP